MKVEESIRQLMVLFLHTEHGFYGFVVLDTTLLCLHL